MAVSSSSLRFFGLVTALAAQGCAPPERVLPPPAEPSGQGGRRGSGRFDGGVLVASDSGVAPAIPVAPGAGAMGVPGADGGTPGNGAGGTPGTPTTGAGGAQHAPAAATGGTPGTPASGGQPGGNPGATGGSATGGAPAPSGGGGTPGTGGMPITPTPPTPTPPTPTPTPPTPPTPTPPPPSATPPIVGSALAERLDSGGLDPWALPDFRSADRIAHVPIMGTFTTSLGKGCDSCHDPSNYQLPTAAKRVTVHMWDGILAKLAMKDGSPLYCDSCHQGKERFLDRGNRASLAAWMQANFVDKLVRRDGAPHTCTSCHTDPSGDALVDRWAAP